MELEIRTNPVTEARLRAGFSSVRKLAASINVPISTCINWEAGKCAKIYDTSAGAFHKFCSAVHITVSEGENYISNLYMWNKNPKIKVVKPKAKDIKVDISINDIEDGKSNPLKDWRLEAGFTTVEAAEYLNIEPSTYALIEDLAMKPTGDDLKSIVDNTGLSFVEIAKMFQYNFVELDTTNAEVPVSVPEIHEQEDILDIVMEPEHVSISQDLASEILDIIYSELPVKEFLRIYNELKSGGYNG